MITAPVFELCPPLRVEHVLQAVCYLYQIDVCHLVGGTRQKAWLAHMRQVAMYLALVHTDRTVGQVAKKFDRDHSCVRRAYTAISRLIKDDIETAFLVGMLEKRMDIPVVREGHTSLEQVAWKWAA